MYLNNRAIRILEEMDIDSILDHNDEQANNSHKIFGKVVGLKPHIDNQANNSHEISGAGPGPTPNDPYTVSDQEAKYIRKLNSQDEDYIKKLNDQAGNFKNQSDPSASFADKIGNQKNPLKELNQPVPYS